MSKENKNYFWSAQSDNGEISGSIILRSDEYPDNESIYDAICKQAMEDEGVYPYAIEFNESWANNGGTNH
jgi:hypothetical protein